MQLPRGFLSTTHPIPSQPSPQQLTQSQPPPTMASSLFNSIQTNTKPSPPLTDHFFCTRDLDSDWPSFYQSITTIPEYSHLSFEELRLQDYAEGRGPPAKSSPASSTAINTPTYSAFTLSSSQGAATPFSSSTWGRDGLLRIAALDEATGRKETQQQTEFRSPLSTTSAGSNPFQSRIITIRVGTNPTVQEDFSVHEELLTRRRSPVIQALLHAEEDTRNGKRKGKERDVEEENERKTNGIITSLPFETEPEVFAIYQKYLYTALIHVPLRPSAPSHLSSLRSPEEAKEHSDADACRILDLYKILLRCYTLGLVIEDSVFQNAVIDSLIYVLRSTAVFPVKLTRLVWEITPRPSFLRNLWLDVLLWCREPDWSDAVEASFKKAEQGRERPEGEQHEVNDNEFVDVETEAEHGEGAALYAEFSRDLDTAYQLATEHGPRDPPFLREVGCWYHGHTGEVCEGWARASGGRKAGNGF